MAIVIRCVGGELTGQSFRLESEITVGREAGNTVVLANDNGVSRRHARIFWLHGLPTIEDLGSRNGTFLNGVRLSQASSAVSSGDEVRIGATTFRVEAALDQPVGQAQPAPTGQSRERSRGERGSRHQRRPEQGSPEGTLYSPSSSSGWPSGCAMPDLSGCMRYLLIIFLIMLIAGIIALIIFGIGAVLTSAGGLGSVSGTPPATSTPDTPQPPPPAGGGDQPQQQQPQQEQKPPQGQSIEGVVIVETKVDFAKRNSQIALPVVLLKWINGTKSPVNKLSGTVELFDRDGNKLAEIPREVIYAGAPVPAGETHQDDLKDGGIVIRKSISGVPASAKVTIQKVE